MYEIFIGALNGDPLYQQHLSWLLSKPAFWLVMMKWIMVAFGVIWILRVLITAWAWKAVCIFLGMIVGAGLVGLMLFQQAKLGFENGQGGALAWRGFGLVIDVFAIGVIVLLLKRLFNGRQPAPDEGLEVPTSRHVTSKPPKPIEHEFHIWFGHYSGIDALTDFFEEQYEDSDRPLNKFAASQGQKTYDHDGFEYGFEPDQPLDSWLTLDDSLEGALPKAYRAAQERGIIDPNIYLLANRDAFSDPRSAAVEGLMLTYLGLFRET